MFSGVTCREFIGTQVQLVVGSPLVHLEGITGLVNVIGMMLTHFACNVVIVGT